jgi:LmbE family N-acetylglucosaminyl deacetylase
MPIEGYDHFGAKVTPDFIIDISGVIDRKAEMLCCHASQREWLRRQHGMDEYIEFMKREAKNLGAMGGFEYGEGFFQHLGHAYPRKNILAEILPSKPSA